MSVVKKLRRDICVCVRFQLLCHLHIQVWGVVCDMKRGYFFNQGFETWKAKPQEWGYGLCSLFQASTYANEARFNFISERKFLPRDRLVSRMLWWPFTLWDLWVQGKHIPLLPITHRIVIHFFWNLLHTCLLIFSHWGPFHRCSQIVNFITEVKMLYPGSSLKRKVTKSHGCCSFVLWSRSSPHLLPPHLPLTTGNQSL